MLKFDGYRRCWPRRGKQEDALLPAVAEQQTLDLLDLEPTQHFTQPPPRYNEASLVKTLEKEGIGRPSTYATIISKIEERGYVEQKERRFFATDIGMIVTDLLVEHFPKVMDLKFTATWKKSSTRSRRKKSERNQVLDEFYEPFSQALKVAETKMSVRGETRREVSAVRQTAGASASARFGKFFGCSGYPECKYIKTARAKRREGGAGPRPTEYNCPKCGKPMLQRIEPAGAVSWLLRLSRMQDDHELRRGRQAGPGQQGDRTRLREMRQAHGAPRRHAAGNSSPAPAIRSAATPRTWTPMAIPSSRS